MVEAKEKYVTHGKYRFAWALFAISIPLLFPFVVGLYAARQLDNNVYFWAGVITSLIFIWVASTFEKTIRREGVAEEWYEAYKANGKSLIVGDAYPGWHFPKFPE